MKFFWWLAMAASPVAACAVAPDAGLSGSAWTVTALNGTALPGPVTISMAYDHKDRVSGVAGCNQFSAQFQNVGDALKVGPTAITKRACAPQIMAYESAFLAVFSGEIGIVELNKKTMRLKSDGGALTAQRDAP